MWQFHSETFKMADAVRASCAAPVFKRPRLEFSPCESDALISFESLSSEERFSIDSGLQEDSYEVTSSSDCPMEPPAHPECPNGAASSAPQEPTGFLSESPSGMLAHESFNGGLAPPSSRQQQLPPGGFGGEEESALEEEEDDDCINEILWVQRQLSCGMDPRIILAEILPKGTFIPSNVNDCLLWRHIVGMLSEPKRPRLTHVNTLDDAVRLLRTCRRVIVLTGAGVSVSCGIPDFRSCDGIYARLSKDYPDLPDPQAMFDIGYFRRDPRPFFKFAKEIYPGQFQPSPSHRFIRLLEKQGRLLRNYTQNIDTLEHAAGIQNVITCHGSFATATCTVCRYKVDSSVIKEDIFNQTIPYCPVCPSGGDHERGIMKPDIVFFGEGLSEEFYECMGTDKQVCDLLIVIGSSLKVRPVAMIPSSIPTNVPQILINREPLKHLTFDMELLGDCDVVIGELCRRLKSEWTIDEDIPSLDLTEVAAPPSLLQQQRPLRPSSSDFPSAEINNNRPFGGLFPSSVQAAGPSSSQGEEESNSCDYRGLSAIRLDDNSEDGSVLSAGACGDAVTRGFVIAGSAKKAPDNSYVFFPPSRYVFPGAEVDKEDEEDNCSTSTDYSSDSESPPRRPPSEECPSEEGPLPSSEHSSEQCPLPTIGHLEECLPPSSGHFAECLPPSIGHSEECPLPTIGHSEECPLPLKGQLEECLPPSSEHSEERPQPPSEGRSKESSNT